MAAQTGLTVVKRFPYRGDTTEEFSNTYHFTGSVPSDATAWRALFDALVTQEKTIYSSVTHVYRGYGYDDDADDATAVWSVDLSVSPETPVAGTLSVGTDIKAPGDSAVWCRWKTSRTNSNGKPIYLRKYFHDARINGATGGDTVLAAQVTALAAFATKLEDGTFIDGRKITARGHTDTIVSIGNSAYITTRTLKRRGKRPGS